MPARKKPNIYIGIGGWTYEDWRGVFYPKGLAQKSELGYASRKLTSIEINGTYYGSQKPTSFIKWREETPDDFVFALKGPRFATNRRVLAEAGASIEKFFDSGVAVLKHKLGPINWQFMPTKKFDAADFETFLKLLPQEVSGQKIRHAVEVRHESFKVPQFIALARKYGIAIVIDADADYPQIADLTAPFVYARIMGTKESQKKGYAPAALKTWVKRIELWASGKQPADLDYVAQKAKPEAAPRDVFLYVISGYKKHNPAAATAMIELLR